MADSPNTIRHRTESAPEVFTPRREQERFVPSGVDAQTWLGFEQRIQQRRYQALIQQINGAIARRDGIAARLALEEANELRPDSAELGELACQIAAIPGVMPRPESVPFGRSRTMNAVSLLVAGMALLVGLEWLRPSPPLASRASAPAIVTAPAVTVPLAAPPTASAPQHAPVTVPRSTVEPREPSPLPTEPQAPEPIATAGIRRAVNVSPPTFGGSAGATFRQAAVVEPRVSPSDGEVPDDYVAPKPRRQPEAYASTSSITARAASAFTANAPRPSGLTAAASTPRPPASTAAVTTPAPAPFVPPASAATSATTATSVAAPLASRAGDENRVAQVLNQYARAYGQLDASAARKVWPSVDERALARAFAGLQSQDVSFDDCDVNISGAKATASCRGRATYVGKIGSRDAHTEPRQWTFELRRDANDAWQIETAQAQRAAYQNR